MSKDGRIERFFESGSIRAVSVGPVIVVHYNGPIDPGILRELVAKRREFAPDSPATLSIVSASTPLPSAEVVAEIFEISRTSHRAIVCEAAVIHGGGPLAVGGRALINTLFSRVRPTPSRLFSRVSDAASFIAGELSRPSLSSVLELAASWLESDSADLPTRLSVFPSVERRESGVRFLDPGEDGTESAAPWPAQHRDVAPARTR